VTLPPLLDHRTCVVDCREGEINPQKERGWGCGPKTGASADKKGRGIRRPVGLRIRSLEGEDQEGYRRLRGKAGGTHQRNDVDSSRQERAEVEQSKVGGNPRKRGGPRTLNPSFYRRPMREKGAVKGDPLAGETLERRGGGWATGA